MQQTLQLLISELRSAWRFRWIGVPIAWAIFLVGSISVARQPNVYEASARFYIDTTSALRPILGNRIVSADLASQLQYVRQALLVREQLERVAREANLDANVTAPEDWDRVVTNLRSRIVINTGGTRRGGPENIYAISYRSQNRDTAAAVVTGMLNVLVEDLLGQNTAGAVTAERFLEERIAEYENRLQAAELILANFKRENADRLPGSQGGYFAQMQRERAELEIAEKALRLALSRRQQLVEQLSSERPVVPQFGTEIEPPPNSIDARIRDHRQQLDRLLLDYTDIHPDVVAIRETLARLEAQRAEQLRALGISNQDQELSGLGSNPVYQAVQIAINEVDVEVATLRADIEDRTGKLDVLQALVDDVPKIEAELQRLTRGYDVLYEQYQSLVQGRETQNLTRKAADADQAEFRIIEPPRAGARPVAPNRLQLIGVILLVALGAAGGACWLIAQLRPVFSTTAKLRELTGLPVLGAVSQAWESRHRLRRRFALVTFSGAIAGLFLLFAVAVVIETKGPGLQALAGLL